MLSFSYHRNHRKIFMLSVLLVATALCAVGCGTASHTEDQPESDTISDTITEVPETELTTVTVMQTMPTTIPETTQVTTTAIQTTMTTTTQTETTTTTNTKSIEWQIVDAIKQDLGYSDIKPYLVYENSELVEYDSETDCLIHKAEMLPERCLGSIFTEEDAIEKMRTVLLETRGEAYIEKIESDYVDVDGVQMHYERDDPIYTVKYYEEYNTWYVVPNPPDGTREDGVVFVTIWDFPPYVIIRGDDGMILGLFG